ncbi:MAG TPA: phage tail sheath subtilisin-like domain-containing protein [Thermodesulfovibrio thiophilus]|nr:phage tail sheath subtilisin-like domain-containing protein [Thermodesulfovibrio thiophilus]
MASYLRPDVYVERVASGAEPIQTQGTAVAGFVGIARRGEIGEATLVTSWTEFTEKFSKGLDTPFMADSDLAYAVYGYFQNGGGTAFIVRTASETAERASVLIPAENGIKIYAKDEGTWGNKLSMKVTSTQENGVDVFNVEVSLDDEVVETFEGLTNDITDENYYLPIINSDSKFITVPAGGLQVGEGAFSGGNDGIADITDADFLGERGLKALDKVEAVRIVAIPGQTSKAVQQGILDYCSGRKDCFGIVDIGLGRTPTEALEDKAEIGGSYGAVYYPWGKVVDPIGKGKLRLTPPSGHIAGVYARTDSERGVYKAPAGTEAVVKGFVEMERSLSNGEVELLNAKAVNCIISKPNKGIVVWGARMATPDKDRFYVSDIRLDIMIEGSLYEGTQWSIFEPNDEKLWSSLTAQVKAFLYNLWVDGALFGATPEEAYFVKCDEELNSQEVRDAGKVIIEVGYAKKKPAEFTIIRITQKANN